MTIFSKIVQGELPCKKVYESDEFLAFYDINPKANVHILAIPKQELKDFNAIDPAFMGRFSAFILQVVEIAGIKDSGYRLITNTGAHSGQEVPHLHFHILGGEQLGAIL